MVNPTDAAVLGDWLDITLQHPNFKLAVSAFEQQYAQAILDTDPKDKEGREEIYYTFNGAKQFIHFLMTITKEHRDQLAKQLEEHANTAFIDNPNLEPETIYIDGIPC